MSRKRSVRRKVFGVLAVVAGLVLLAFELGRPTAAGSAVERWFWIAVGLGVFGLGLVELLSPPPPPPDA
jgi:formate-dependent nitrite reductase membrane component NrfD